MWPDGFSGDGLCLADIRCFENFSIPSFQIPILISVLIQPATHNALKSLGIMDLCVAEPLSIGIKGLNIFVTSLTLRRLTPS